MVPLKVCVCDTTIESVEPPVAFTAYVDPAPTTKRLRRSGVPLEPLHRTQPVGILATEPDHRTIVPEGTRLAAAIAACTNAVVAICVLLVEAVA